MCHRTADYTYPVYDVSVNDEIVGKVTVQSTVWQSAGLINNEKLF
jgi:hypothetical protein